MRKPILIIALCLFVYSCTNSQNQQRSISDSVLTKSNVQNNKSDSTLTPEHTPKVKCDSCELSDHYNYDDIWYDATSLCGSKNYTLIKGNIDKYDLSTVKKAMRLFKKSWVKVKLDSVSKNVAFVTIVNSEEFTGMHGTTGPLCFKASFVYTLTEVPNIKGVYFNYEEGDHGGQPGLVTRKDIMEEFNICEHPKFIKVNNK